ncbi:MAG: hypothetical protein AB8B80_12370 [Marinicellaceae bacterium]
MELKSSYVIAVADQLSFVSAFLGGVSATILLSIIIFSSPKRSVSMVITCAAVSACSLLIAVIAAWRLTIGLHPDLPFVPDPKTLNLLWNSMIAGYSIGLISLILCIGLSGWIRSKKQGLITSLIAIIALLFFSMTSIYAK